MPLLVRAQESSQQNQNEINKAHLIRHSLIMQHIQTKFEFNLDLFTLQFLLVYYYITVVNQFQNTLTTNLPTLIRILCLLSIIHHFKTLHNDQLLFLKLFVSKKKGYGIIYSSTVEYTSRMLYWLICKIIFDCYRVQGQKTFPKASSVSLLYCFARGLSLNGVSQHHKNLKSLLHAAPPLRFHDVAQPVSNLLFCCCKALFDQNLAFLSMLNVPKY